MTYVSPFGHPDVIAGQGTCAKELFDEVGKLDHLFCGVGGGGLISGCSLVAEQVSPECKIWGVEPDAAHDAAISLEQNRVVSIPNQKTIADGCNTPKIGENTLKMMRKYIEGIVHVKDPALVNWMKFFAERQKVVIEPTGCLGIAGLER